MHPTNRQRVLSLQSDGSGRSLQSISSRIHLPPKRRRTGAVHGEVHLESVLSSSHILLVRRFSIPFILCTRRFRFVTVENYRAKVGQRPLCQRSNLTLSSDPLFPFLNKVSRTRPPSCSRQRPDFRKARHVERAHLPDRHRVRLHSGANSRTLKS
jgi:hypothetical protein